MNKLKFLSTSLILTSFLFIGISTTNAQDSIPAISEQIEFREEFGLDTSVDKIEALNQDTETLAESNYEIPLTKEEEKELDERFDTQNDNLPIIRGFLDSQYSPDEYTLYVDQANNGEVVVKLKNTFSLSSIEQEEAILDELKEFGPMFEYKLEEANYSEEDLNKISEKIWDIKSESDLEFDSTSVDVINEEIIVGIQDYNSEKENKITQELSEFPVKVVHVNAPEDSRGSYGGERITNNRGGACSSGYYASSGSNRYLVTAGHCSRSYNSSTGNATWNYSDRYSYGGSVLGGVSSIRYGGRLDALTVSVSSSNANSNININGAVRRMTSSQARNADTVGQTVCRVGFASGRSQCGSLRSKNVSYSISGANFNGLRGTNLSSTSGDSGGTTYNGNQYLGVTKGSGGGYSQVYTHIAEFNAELGLSTYLQ